MVYARNTPPKNRISVARNIHMPRRSAPRCCSMSSKWCLRAPAPTLADIGLLPRLGQVQRVLVRPAHHPRRVVEVVGDGRALGRGPLQPGRPPRVAGGPLAREE